MRYRVERTGGWDVAAPNGRRWSGAPSQAAAFGLAQSLAGIDVMLTRLRFAHYRQRYLLATGRR